MKKINKEEITKKIRELVDIGKDWCEYGHFRYYKIMLDTDDGDIWIDVFLSTNDWKVYHDDAIVQLDYYPGYEKEIAQNYINSAMRYLEKAGWTIE